MPLGVALCTLNFELLMYVFVVEIIFTFVEKL